MGFKRTAFASRAWSALRMGLLWARKGGAFRWADHKRLKPSTRAHSDTTHYYLERQFSMDETPAFSFRLHRPASLRWISCVRSAAAADYDDCHKERNIFKWDKRSGVCDDGGRDEELVEEEEGIDSKAEEFIARFYDEMKMKRQMSVVAVL